MESRRLVLTPAAREFLERWHDASPYVVAHTSGSTGTPKEIHLAKADMRASAHATIDFFGLNPSSTLVLPLSPSYIAGMMQIVRAEEAGCSLIVLEPSNSPSLPDGSDITLLPIVPSQAESVMASAMLPRVKNLIIGGAPLSPEMEQRIAATGINTFATYGMTETCSHVALRPLGSQEFQALPGFTFSTDTDGCLTVTSTTLSFGTLHTTDIVTLTSPTGFIWRGRRDHVINSGGLKIHPEEIEHILTPLLPSGASAYVTSRPSRQWGEEAVIVSDSPLPHILDRLKPLLPPRHCPKDIIVIKSIPLTSSGKIIRKKL